MFNAMFQNCLDYLYLNNIRYLPQGKVYSKYQSNDKRISLLEKYLKKDGTYRKSIPIYSALSYLYPQTTESNLKCNAYALNILSSSNISLNSNPLVNYLHRESLHQISTHLNQNITNSNVIFNILQVIGSFISIKEYKLAEELYSSLVQLNINWRSLPIFTLACLILVTEQLKEVGSRAIINERETEALTKKLFESLSLPHIINHNSFTGETGYSTHELGYLLYFTIQLPYTTTHSNALHKILVLLNRIHQDFIRNKTLPDGTGTGTKKIINNSGIALIASVFFIASIKTEDLRFGNAALFLTDYLYSIQDRYLGLLPNTLPVWSSKSPLQYPLWTQYYLLLASNYREGFLNSLK